VRNMELRTTVAPIWAPHRLEDLQGSAPQGRPGRRDRQLEGAVMETPMGMISCTPHPELLRHLLPSFSLHAESDVKLGQARSTTALPADNRRVSTRSGKMGSVGLERPIEMFDGRVTGFRRGAPGRLDNAGESTPSTPASRAGVCWAEFPRHPRWLSSTPRPNSWNHFLERPCSSSSRPLPLLPKKTLGAARPGGAVHKGRGSRAGIRSRPP